MGVDKLTCTYLPQGPAPRFPHGWLKVSSSPKYPLYDWMDTPTMVEYALQIKC